MIISLHMHVNACPTWIHLTDMFQFFETTRSFSCVLNWSQVGRFTHDSKRILWVNELIQSHVIEVIYIYMCINAAWWFGTCFIFPHIGNVMTPTDLHIFQRGRYTTNQYGCYFHDSINFPSDSRLSMWYVWYRFHIWKTLNHLGMWNRFKIWPGWLWWMTGRHHKLRYRSSRFHTFALLFINSLKSCGWYPLVI